MIGFNPSFSGSFGKCHASQIVFIELSNFIGLFFINESFAIFYNISKWCVPHVIASFL